MNSAKLKSVLKASVLIGLSSTLMGNQGCQQAPPVVQERQLKRRVQLGHINAPEITITDNISGNKKFDFAYVANLQMFDVLNKTNVFSAANGDLDPAGMDNVSQAEYNSCEIDQEINAVDAKTGAPLFATFSKTSISHYGGCLIDMPQGVVSGDIFDFYLEKDTGGGLTVPFSLSGAGGTLGGTYNYKKYALDLQMKVKNPVTLNVPEYTSGRKSYLKNKSGSFKIDFGFFGVGFSNYFNSGLGTVVNDGLTDGINDLAAQWAQKEKWYTMVLKNCDKYIYINGGSTDLNLKENDIVSIQNVEYRWEGDICKSPVLGEVANSPVAYARIVSAGMNMSKAEVIENDPMNYPRRSDQKIYPGARVYMKKTVEQQQAEAAAAAAAANKSTKN